MRGDEVPIVVERRGSSQWVHLNRPAVLNAATAPMVQMLLDAVRAADRDPEVSLLVLTGRGGAFCSGIDLRDLGSVDEAGRSFAGLREGMRNSSVQLIRAMVDADVPIVAGVNGVAAGFGLGLVLASDLVLTSDSARLMAAFGRRGLAPDSGVAWLLPRIAGVALAKRMLLAGEELTGRQATEAGLSVGSVLDVEFDGSLEALVDRVAALPRFANRMAKRLVNRGLEHSLDDSLEFELLAQELAVRSPEFAAAMASWRTTRGGRVSPSPP